ncbi:MULTISPECIES: DUF4317 domain-containing protein [Clostridium]|uniref:DUF4317 domain-containing protein n=1 Tax=Clostridium TaxID=1485 RepID=UPI000824C21A|nr:MULTISPECIES: DUF4317 domain-containing protein [Clostridium]PJI07607.1 DUF4317 domain-containing protein [Clostridium sp. CT7]
MRKKDILELKKRLKKNECTFTKMCGCYVNSEKNIILKLNETFLNLEEEEFFKYLEIAKKTLSGTVGNNLLELNFPLDEEKEGGRQYSLMSLKMSQLKDESMLDSFYKLIIDNYEYAGNFLILVFHDAYDVMTKTTDNAKLDESEEVYEYILCAVCPVTLAKPALGYIEDENRIGARIRDWIVGSPDLGFTFPAFIDRSADIDSVIYYTKNAKDPHPEFMEEVLGCSSKKTATEQKETFHAIVHEAVGNDEEKAEHLFGEIQETISNAVDEHSAMSDDDNEPLNLTNDNIQDILAESGIPEEVTTKIQKSYTEEFGDTPPNAEHLIDKKVIAANKQRNKEIRLQKKVAALEEELQKSKQNDVLEPEKESALEVENDSTVEINSDSALDQTSDSETESMEDSTTTEESTAPNYDVVVHVKPEKVDQIKSQIIDGKKCIVIPIDDNEQANVNGVSTSL